MLGEHGRNIPRTFFTPLAKLLAKLGVTPNLITVVGTVATILVSVLFLATGHWGIGALVLAFVLFADSLDGILARVTGKSSDFGAFLDSSLDRLGDGAVFGSLLYSFVFLPDSWMKQALVISGIITLVAGATVPYVRAKAEAFGVRAQGGIAERTDRLLIVLLGCGLVGFGAPLWVACVAFLWVAFASSVTVLYRLWSAYQGFNAKVK
ncbi:CDP-alcohol phosphatidyltransferase [Gleimia coleocanis DSM 15436]|uniref:CDP-alcohol phosphatidyltransferase n=1 Tax=Gleimia coleocanis DSM 15436 TaxID=525245 RepID=C0W1Q9_9ACTO|nr:CDP-alcohol phosphatidyltransferase family protein [Gleimia coleocanis]EEH63425.1 CDP-alcohol phosphatidyltransferase [Gleimia coleocanis DSM 15436]